ncbi:SDR family oxidoreductase [Aminobacter sp. MSH1]|uniref:SDR family NAD(P)-dependent oxidoreductase n=1 Tax=Aminobacter sp. MSH1 TaxID=374606 RepID=UPI000D390EC7|nr:SDR family oxidoreductase [Aminobacter sp. MSH1]
MQSARLDSEQPFFKGGVAVITGAASGIGRAAAIRLVELGMNLVLFDNNSEALAEVAATLGAHVHAISGDVSNPADIERLRDYTFSRFEQVNVLMNNAALYDEGSGNWSGLDAWRRIVDVNLWGVLYSVHAFAPFMLEQKSRGAIINTSSKAGVTNPPGKPAYGASKAAVRMLTEQLAHGFLDTDGSVSAHLLTPGFTHTPMTVPPGQEKPTGAWSPEQVVAKMIEGVERGDFYIICEDNEVSFELDAARILWSAGDIVENRPALSRWHPLWKHRYEAFVMERTKALNA